MSHIGVPSSPHVTRKAASRSPRVASAPWDPPRGGGHGWGARRVWGPRVTLCPPPPQVAGWQAQKKEQPMFGEEQHVRYGTPPSPLVTPHHHWDPHVTPLRPSAPWLSPCTHVPAGAAQHPQPPRPQVPCIHAGSPGSHRHLVSLPAPQGPCAPSGPQCPLCPTSLLAPLCPLHPMSPRSLLQPCWVPRFPAHSMSIMGPRGSPTSRIPHWVPRGPHPPHVPGESLGVPGAPCPRWVLPPPGGTIGPSSAVGGGR